MAEKHQRIGKDGRIMTVVKKSTSREKRIEQHMHGRSDHIRRTGEGKIVFAVIAGGLTLIFLIWLGWRLLG